MGYLVLGTYKARATGKTTAPKGLSFKFNNLTIYNMVSYDQVRLPAGFFLDRSLGPRDPSEKAFESQQINGAQSGDDTNWRVCYE